MVGFGDGGGFKQLLVDGDSWNGDNWGLVDGGCGEFGCAVD